MIARLVELCARNPLPTVLVVGCLSLWGVLAAERLPLDANPDISDPQVIVLSEWPGRSADTIEARITAPLSARLLGTPRVTAVRGQSMAGLSFVYVVFDEGTDLSWGRARVAEVLSAARAKLPDDVSPTLGPDATGVGWIVMYALLHPSGVVSLAELRSLQDAYLRPALASVPGVAEVAPLGGMVKEYQVDVDPNRLIQLGVTLDEVEAALRAGTDEDVGVGELTVGDHQASIRGRAAVRDVAELRAIPLHLSSTGAPIVVGDVAHVATGPAARQGLVDLDGRGEVVGGIVLVRHGENALRVIDAVKERLEELRVALPPGVELRVTYDRSELIRDAVGSLSSVLVQEMLVVSLAIFLFLMHASSALVPIVVLPVAVLLSLIPMLLQGVTASVMSLGGIAVAIGAMVDAAIVIIENVHVRLARWRDEGEKGVRLDVLIAAMQEVAPSIFYSLLVITVAFAPVFTLEAAEGRLFRPLAFTKTYAMGFAALLAVTLTPALAAWLIRGTPRRDAGQPLMGHAVRAYARIVRTTLRHRRVVLGGALALVAMTVPAFLALDEEFMPQVNEGAILYMPTAPEGMTMDAAAHVLQGMDEELAAFPEVQSVFGKIGRAETATDPAPMNMAEITVMLRPRHTWRPHLTWDVLVGEMDKKLQYPGMPNIWWMPIQARTEMLATGVRGPLAMQLFGSDARALEETASAIEGVLAAVPGTRSAVAERSAGGFFLDLEIDRQRAQLYGLRAADVNRALTTAVGGREVGRLREGREQYAVRLRYGVDFRSRPEALADVLVATPTGAQIPLGDISRREFRRDAPMIRSEGGQLTTFVLVDPGARPISDYVSEANRAIAASVVRPAGVRFAWTGEYRSLERARAKLRWVVPLTLLVVLLLLLANTRSLTESLIVLLAVPFSLVGAVWLLYALDYHLSVAVWVGLLALAGLDAETGVVMLLYLKLSYAARLAEGRMHTDADLSEAIVDGAARRLRPKLMTVLTTFLGLLPAMLASGAGAEVTRRIAAPMVGGLATSFVLELLVYPVLFAAWKGRRLAIVGSPRR